MNNHIVESYIQNPSHNFVMPEASIVHHEGNSICGDDIIVYLKIQDNKIIDYSYSGNCSTITKAAASFLADIIIHEDIDTITKRDYSIPKKHEFIVSQRRKRAAVIPILAARNAIHKYKNDNIYDTFDDLLETN